MYIDAPFELTTSREEVLENSRWNAEILNHVYDIIQRVILAEKSDFPTSSQFLGIRTPGVTRYGENCEVKIFSDDFLNKPVWTRTLKETRFLPTFEEGVFVTPTDASRNGTCRRYPSPVTYILGKGAVFRGVGRDCILNVSADPRFDPILNALGCEMANTRSVVDAISPFVARFMDDKQFRARLYPYMRDNPSSLYKGLCVIPVYSADGESTDFLMWNDKIYVSDGKKSTDTYYVLNEEYLSKRDCETALNVNINKMDFTQAKILYREDIETKIRTWPDVDAYEYLLAEFRSGKLERFDAASTLRGLMLMAGGKLPLKNAKGEVVTYPLFINSMGPDCFADSDAVLAMTVAEECEGLARLSGAGDLSDIHYDEIYGMRPLTADDIEAFQNRYFKHRLDILCGYVRDGFVSNELMKRYGLYIYAEIGEDDDDESDYDFPSESISPDRLSRRIDEIINGRRKLHDGVKNVPVRVYYDDRGNPHEPNMNEIRDKTLERYSVDLRGGTSGMKCVCQRCKKVKRRLYIDVRDIETNPDYVWDEMRISLCLECSKLFGEMRANEVEYEAFLDELENTDYRQEEPIEIPDGTGESIGFTQAHLAEIQAILRWERSETEKSDKKRG